MHKNKRKKQITDILKRNQPCEEEYLEDEIQRPVDFPRNSDNLEASIKHVVEKLNGFESILQNITTKIKSRYNKIDTKRIDKALDSEEIVEESVTLAFPLQTIEEVSQFETDDLDSVVVSFIKDLLHQHKNFSIVFKKLLSDELILLFTDWENMSRYRFFSEILYDAIKESFGEYDDFILEMRKQILKAVNRIKPRDKGNNIEEDNK